MLTRCVKSNVIEEILYGDDTVKHIQIVREPISGVYTNLLELFSCFSFRRGLKERDMRELYHVKLVLHVDARVLELDKDKVVRLEEHEESATAETISVDMNGRNIKLTQLLSRTESFMGDIKYNGYSASENCCQDFALCVLLANGLYDETVEAFIKQDVRDLFSPCMVVSTDFATDCVRWFYNWFRT